MKGLLLSATVLFFVSSVVLVGAAHAAELEAVPEPPELPDPLETGESIEPVVTIIREDDAVIEEYRVNGFLYMVKVTPSFGTVYYLVDNDGDGQMDSRSSDIEDVIVPQWVLFSW